MELCLEDKNVVTVYNREEPTLQHQSCIIVIHVAIVSSNEDGKTNK